MDEYNISLEWILEMAGNYATEQWAECNAALRKYSLENESRETITELTEKQKKQHERNAKIWDEISDNLYHMSRLAKKQKLYLKIRNDKIKELEVNE